MSHLIEFLTGFTADVEISPRDRLEQIEIRPGTIIRAVVVPSVVEMSSGPVEVADLYFEDGFITRGVPYERFRFVEVESVDSVWE